MEPCPTTIAIADASQQRDRKLKALPGKSRQKAYRTQQAGTARAMRYTTSKPWRARSDAPYQVGRAVLCPPLFLLHGDNTDMQAATATRMPPPPNPCGWRPRRWLLRARDGQ